ncbi:type I-E CRISPR-associated protein Cas6/Cse3/CasE [Corynebacterium sp. sy017]|uniref:type I-E CRISPR-associated protein Cas6/Cse3/CasE n=1 Tax=unclassified Corynebacterium TaxID=2624378 RepID=UPI001185CE99|nr:MULTISPECIES: type I-E CRISPR-associated protein Cas6/Cse3/CasE [unclassified Corynebacterium]MBP3088477.1 type I-E CRISPR-associated protein Cas6/Cse3/CasE [Corynebacterium sp. sy017]TSD91785.1 type I-E CRISPR-associated protein Cas6/Cse3/CasE [Corynebacterium sp. SY003]
MNDVKETQVFWTKLPVHTALSSAREAGALSNSRSVNTFLQDPRSRHRMVMSLFPDIDSSTPREKFKILFRLENTPGQAPYFLIQSNVEPTKNLTTEVLTKEVSFPQFNDGDQIELRLSINPVKRQENTTVPIRIDPKTGPAPLFTWIINKLSPAINIDEIVNHNQELLGAKTTDTNSKKLVVQIDTIDAIGTVSNASQLHEWLSNGIGRAKSYGCGLLTARHI